VKYEVIWKLVNKIPFGKVATYGQIADLAGLDGHARFVGYALHGTPRTITIPWHRVINSQGKISLSGPSAQRQRKLLEAEKIVFSPSGKIDLKKYGWRVNRKFKTQPHNRGGTEFS
jgi:methylated-DNA-protein-cysteine methyltransferase related protein